MIPPCITCQDIWKTYGQGSSRCVALRGVNLSINRGELRLLMGPSGSGKTTLISIIAGMLTQDSGQCLVNGVDLNHLPDADKAHYRGRQIGFVFQAFNLIPSLTNEENISIPLLIQGYPRKEALEKSCTLLDELGLKEKIGGLPTALSGGEQQRVAIARALVHDPEMIVCDEPTSFLDHHTGLKMMEILKKMVETRHVTLIVVTHDPRIVQFADKIDYLEDGALIDPLHMKR